MPSLTELTFDETKFAYTKDGYIFATDSAYEPLIEELNLNVVKLKNQIKAVYGQWEIIKRYD